jgi:hypothetical protein
MIKTSEDGRHVVLSSDDLEELMVMAANLDSSGWRRFGNVMVVPGHAFFDNHSNGVEYAMPYFVQAMTLHDFEPVI